MARTTSKSAVKKVNVSNSSKSKPKNNLKNTNTRKNTTLKSKDNINTTPSTTLKDKPITKIENKSSNRVTAKVPPTKVTKTVVTKKNISTSNKSSSKKGTSTRKSSSTNKKNKTRKNVTVKTDNVKKEIDNKLDIVEDIISDLDVASTSSNSSSKFSFDDPNDTLGNHLDEEEKKIIDNEFREDILDENKFNIIDNINNEIDIKDDINKDIDVKDDINKDIDVKDDIVDEIENDIISSPVSDNTTVIEDRPRRSTRRRKARYDMLEDPFRDDVDFSKSVDVESEFNNKKYNLIDEKYKSLEDDLRNKYGDIDVPIIKEKEIVKTREIPVTEVNDNSEVGRSILDYISQRVLNVFLCFFAIVFLLMCIAFVCFIIFVSTF